MKLSEKILFLLILGLLVSPAIQKETGIIPLAGLKGDFVLALKPEFSWRSWMSGQFQADYDKYLEDHIGFRNPLVRLTNQLDFTLFHKIRTEGVVLGKNNVLIEYDYIRAFCGGDFLGEANIDRRIRRLKFVQDYLKREKNIDFVLVFEPGKASFYPEYIPDRYLLYAKPETNYGMYKQKATEYGVRFIDYNQWFLDLKPVAKYPLYPQYGTHWSIYGMSFVVDSLVNYVEHLRGIDLREVIIDTLITEKRARTPDYDMGDALNILCRLPEREVLAYPEIKFGPVAGKYFPMVLVVGDSYFWNIFNTNLPYTVFKNQAFWYFGNWVYPETYRDTLQVPQLNLQEEIEKQEVIFLMVTERFLHKFDWGLVDNLYKLYGIESNYDRLYDIKTRIWIYTEWFDMVVAKAGKNGISLAEMLELEARYIYQMDNPEGYMTLRGQEHYEWSIRNDSQWLEAVRGKANERGIPLDEMIRIEADYMFQTYYPEAYGTYQQINRYKEMIRNDMLMLEEIRQQASYYYLTEDEMLQIAAERMLDESRR